MNGRLGEVTDSRDSDLTDFSAATILWTVILMFICRLGARRQIQFVMDCPNLVSFLKLLSRQDDLHKTPHGDTARDLLKRLPFHELRDVCTDLVRSMIENRRLEGFRLIEQLYLIALDGTGWLALGHESSTFTEGCLTTELGNGQTLYYRPVLEAKLVTRSGLALSVETEFPENVSREGLSPEKFKQDCEQKGARRLLPRLRERFPHLPICMLMDSLHANEPMFALCELLDLRFLTVLKEGSLPTLYREFYDLVALTPENRKVNKTPKAFREIRWIVDIDYNGRKLHVLECVETDSQSGEVTRWLWVTDIRILPENCVALVEGARQRWRTENEGYNVQKNGGYAMEHAYAKTPNAAKNFYLLLQIAHLLAQLFECRLGGKKKVSSAFGSLRNLAARLLDSLRTLCPLQGKEINDFLNTQIQLRLDTS